MSIDIGVMLRGQYPFGVDMAHMAEDLLEQARLADSLGYDSITKGSHYSTPKISLPLHKMSKVASCSAKSRGL